MEMNTPGSWTPNGWLEWSEPPTMLSPKGPPALGRQISWGQKGMRGQNKPIGQQRAPEALRAAARSLGMGRPVASTGRRCWGRRDPQWVGAMPEVKPRTPGAAAPAFMPGYQRPEARAVWTGGGEKTGLTSTGYGPSRAAASKLGASLSGPGSPGVAVTTGVTAEGGGGGERDGGLGERGPPASRSSSRAMVGEAAVSRDTAWSCLASVTSTPLICKSQLVRGAMGRPWWRECRSGAPVHSPTGHGRRPAECLPGGQRRPQRCGR